MEALNILYIGHNENFITDYGLNHDKIEKVVHRKNGFLAFNYLLKSKTIPDIIFCESNVSGINAYQFHKLLRIKDRVDNVVFILLNDSLSQRESIYALKQGVDEIIIKPFLFKSYLNRINFLYDYRHLRKIERKSSRNINQYANSIVKRIFDIIVAITALIMIFPVLILTIIAMKLESKGPLFYSSKRVGTGYKIFNFYKFRSMYVDAEERLKDLKGLNQYDATNPDEHVPEFCEDCKSLEKPCSSMLFVDGKEICERHYLKLKKVEEGGTFIKIKNDPRITKVGNFIRNTSIDELPQLINVLKGDMSIVGNRPLPLYEAELLTSDNWAERFMAPAGITGLWQVEKRGGGEMSEDERKSLDNKYARNHSFLSDIKLILKTIPALLQSENV